jgi:phosphatidylglycerophosphatase B
MMPEKKLKEASNVRVFLWAVLPAITAWAFIPLTFVLPYVDSTRAPYFDLTQTFSQLTYWITQSGGKYGAAVVAVAMLIQLVIFCDSTYRQKMRPGAIVVLIAAICAGGGAALNEDIVKTRLKIPRPNIVWLAGDDGAGPLGMTAEEFYASGDKATRSMLLSNVLNARPRPLLLSPSIEAHWVEETGFSLPSGHAFAAMFFATFFLMLAATYVSFNRLWLFYTLLPWALAVCYSRPILRVHTPMDITIGGLQGLLLGLLAWAVARLLLRKFS